MSMPSRGGVQSLESLLNGSGNVVELLRNQQAGPNVYPGVPAGVHQLARRAAGLAADLRAVQPVLSHGRADGRRAGRARVPQRPRRQQLQGIRAGQGQAVRALQSDGYVIGDVILFYLAENQFNLVGRAPVLNWVQFHAATRTSARDLQLRRAHGGAPRSAEPPPLPLPDAGSERHEGHRDRHRSPGAGTQVLQHVRHRDRRTQGARAAPRHGWPARLRADGPVGRRRRGARGAGRGGQGARHAAGRRARLLVERAGIGLDTLAAARGLLRREDEALSANGSPSNHYEAKASIGGSFVSDNIEDYYLTPWDLGYGPFVKFDHDFIGREALEKMAAGPHRRKVTLALDNVSVTRCAVHDVRSGPARQVHRIPQRRLLHASLRPRHRGRQARRPVDLDRLQRQRRQDADARDARRDPAEPGTEVTLVWGEPDGGTRKPTVERHKQVEIKAVVSPLPYSNVARTAYADSWRNKSG